MLLSIEVTCFKKVVQMCEQYKKDFVLAWHNVSTIFDKKYNNKSDLRADKKIKWFVFM